MEDVGGGWDGGWIFHDKAGKQELCVFIWLEYRLMRIEGGREREERESETKKPGDMEPELLD